MFHFTIINRLKPAPQGAEPLVICYEENSNRIRSIHQTSYRLTSGLERNKALSFTTTDCSKTTRSQIDKNLGPRAIGPQFVTDSLFQKYPDSQSESGSTITENLLTNT